jgi:hypothetical protein
MGFCRSSVDILTERRGAALASARALGPISMLVILVLFTVFSLPLTAAAQQKVDVAVLHSGDDSVGAKLAFAVREAIRRSAGYQVATSRDALLRINCGST